jgi:hypothetical protein
MIQTNKINRHNNSSGDRLGDQCNIDKFSSLVYMDIYFNNSREFIRRIDCNLPLFKEHRTVNFEMAFMTR